MFFSFFMWVSLADEGKMFYLCKRCLNGGIMRCP